MNIARQKNSHKGCLQSPVFWIGRVVSALLIYLLVISPIMGEYKQVWQFGEANNCAT
jgi:hypothetical protein